MNILEKYDVVPQVMSSRWENCYISFDRKWEKIAKCPKLHFRLYLGCMVSFSIAKEV